MVKMLLRYYENDNGVITVIDTDIREFGRFDIYDKIGLVGQISFIFNSTIENNITMYRSVSEHTLEEAVWHVNIAALTAQNANQEIGDSGNQISGGERQRIAFARVLLSDPKVIIVDEPIASLDPDNKQQINDLIFSMNSVTRIVITHDWDDNYLAQFDGVVDLREAEAQKTV